MSLPHHFKSFHDDIERLNSPIFEKMMITHKFLCIHFRRLHFIHRRLTLYPHHLLLFITILLAYTLRSVSVSPHLVCITTLKRRHQLLLWSSIYCRQ